MRSYPPPRAQTESDTKSGWFTTPQSLPETSHRFSLVYKVQCYHSLKSLSPQLLSQQPSDSEDGIGASTWLIQYALFQNSLFVHYQKTCSFFFEVWASGCSWKRNIRFNDHCSQQLWKFVQSIFLFFSFFQYLLWQQAPSSCEREDGKRSSSVTSESKISSDEEPITFFDMLSPWARSKSPLKSGLNKSTKAWSFHLQKACNDIYFTHTGTRYARLFKYF